MVAKIAGALIRAILVALVVAMPSLAVPDPSGGSSEVIALVALCFGVFVFIEYVSSYPSLLEFRDAPPFNRVRFASLAVTVGLVTLICRGVILPSGLSDFVTSIGSFFGHLLNFQYSPVRLFALMLETEADSSYNQLILSIAGISYTISLLTVFVFLCLLLFTRWPSNKKPFNVWVNLPTFDPTAGGDVVSQLAQDARINASLGFLLPFLLPLLVYLAALVWEPVALATPQSLVWTVTAWSVLSTNLLMRGIAMARVASMISYTRRQSTVRDRDVLLPA